jgi:serine/threonine protein kinase
LKPLGFSVATAEQIKMASEIEDSDFSPCSTPRSIGAPDQWIFMAMYELCEHGDLSSFLTKNPSKATDIVFLRRFLISVVDAIGHMHKRGFVHCDVKPENILVDSKQEPRLADFGMSQQFSDRMIAQGTPSFLAPEVVEAWFDPRAPHRFEDKIDIFSVGVMALYIVSGKYPFRRITRRLRKGISFSPKELKEIFLPADRCVECIEQLSPQLADIVHQCMSHDVDERPTARALLKMMKDV